MEDGNMVREIGANGIVYLGVAKSVKAGDNRVAVPPQYIPSLKPAAWNNGRERTRLEILVEEGAGNRAGFSDEEYQAAGATIVSLGTILERAHILLDVKQRLLPSQILADGVNIFYAHVEKGQGKEQLRALLEQNNVTAYSPETIWVTENSSGNLVRGTNLGYYSGIGGVHLMLEGIKLSYQLRGAAPDAVPFSFFPEVDGASEQDITQAYEKIGTLERSMRFAILGGPKGMVSSGAQDELRRAGLSFDLLYKDSTQKYGKDDAKNQEFIAEKIRQYDAILNATVWKPGDPRIITKRQILTMKEGAVLMDDTCDKDGSSTKESEGDPVKGGVRFSYESSWGEKNTFYWVGSERHTFNDDSPRTFLPGEVRVLYNVIGMIPGGTSTAQAASEAYFGMIFPYLTNIIRAVSQGTELPKQGLIVKDGRIVHEGNGITEKVGLRTYVQEREDLAQFRKYL